MQWTALEYLFRANRFSRTPSAFAKYNATSRGTASQTMKALVDKGYANRTTAPSDRRSARLDLTEAGRAKLSEHPSLLLCDAIERLRPEARAALQEGLTALLAEVQEAATERNGVGTCRDCACLTGCEQGRHRGGEFFCQATRGGPLNRGELDQICVSCTPRGSTGQ